MPLELVTPEKPDQIPVTALKDSDLAVITKWAHWGYVGRIIQRFGDQLVTLGASRSYSISQIPDDPRCKVRLLRVGETLRIAE